ncbi:MAG: hypothetical protein Q7R81_02110 [Candidatus Peregrinibacteria bacterium]|nr:hypothetical protein [Candidatus Peregrinibacteria bacterium]
MTTDPNRPGNVPDPLRREQTNLPPTTREDALEQSKRDRDRLRSNLPQNPNAPETQSADPVRTLTDAAKATGTTVSPDQEKRLRDFTQAHPEVMSRTASIIQKIEGFTETLAAFGYGTLKMLAKMFGEESFIGRGLMYIAEKPTSKIKYLDSILQKMGIGLSGKTDDAEWRSTVTTFDQQIFQIRTFWEGKQTPKNGYDFEKHVSTVIASIGQPTVSNPASNPSGTATDQPATPETVSVSLRSLREFGQSIVKSEKAEADKAPTPSQQPAQVAVAPAQAPAAAPGTAPVAAPAAAPAAAPTVAPATAVSEAPGQGEIYVKGWRPNEYFLVTQPTRPLTKKDGTTEKNLWTKSVTIGPSGLTFDGRPIKLLVDSKEIASIQLRAPNGTESTKITALITPKVGQQVEVNLEEIVKKVEAKTDSKQVSLNRNKDNKIEITAS